MKNRTGWLLSAVLIALNIIPLGAGLLRLAQLWGGAPVSPENARFLAAPLLTALHLSCSSVFGLLGAFQFVPQLRRRSPGWHRNAGRVLVACGLVSGLTGIWMTLFFPRVGGDGALLYVLRLVFGSAMVACLVRGYAAARGRDMAAHRAWMIRGYAIGVGAGTQVVVHIPWLLLGGAPGELARALLLGAGWAINLAVAEWVIRRSAPRPARPALAPGPGLPQK